MSSQWLARQVGSGFSPVFEPEQVSALRPLCARPTVRRMTGTRKDIVVVDLGGSTIKVGFAGDAASLEVRIPRRVSLPRSMVAISMP